MIDRLELLTNRYNEINEELLKPEVLSDFNKQKKLSKEKGGIEEAVNKYAEYKDLVSEIEGLKELVMDPEMHEIASIELDEKKEKLASLTKEIEILLLPKDENDGKDVIMEGRDIGTYVFPNADVKIYLDADVEERAKRRFKENQEKGIDVSFEDVLENIKKRDENDKHKEIGSLKIAEDAVIVDSTKLSIEEMADAVEKIILEKTGEK